MSVAFGEKVVASPTTAMKEKTILATKLFSVLFDLLKLGCGQSQSSFIS